MTHELKTWPGPFAAILDGRKRHEVRRDDRPFAVGDTLRLREWVPACTAPAAASDAYYTGREVNVRVTYLTSGGERGLPADLCVMSISLEKP